MAPTPPEAGQLVTRGPDKECQDPALVPAPLLEVLLRAVCTAGRVNRDVTFGLEDPSPKACILGDGVTDTLLLKDTKNEGSSFGEKFGKVCYDFRCSFLLACSSPTLGMYPTVTVT